MKLQLQGQRVRLRLDEAELARLLAGDMIVNATDLGAGIEFRQLLGLYAGTAPLLQATAGQWRWHLPEAAVREYVGRLPCREALGFELACHDESGEAGAVVSLRFEVDVRDSLQLRGARHRHDNRTAP